MMEDNLTIEEIQARYGHGASEPEIKSLFPYDNRDFKKEKYVGQDYTVTYDPLTAYALRKRYTVKVWGQKEKNHRAFVFLKQRTRAIVF